MPKKKMQKKINRPVSKAKNQSPSPIPRPAASNFKIKPLADRIVIREDNESKEEKTASGIIIPISAQEDKGSKRGKIVAVGEGKYENGQLVPISVNVGDVVLFQWGDKVKIDNEEYYLVRESEILAIIR